MACTAIQMSIIALLGRITSNRVELCLNVGIGVLDLAKMAVKFSKPFDLRKYDPFLNAPVM